MKLNARLWMKKIVCFHSLTMEGPIQGAPLGIAKDHPGVAPKLTEMGSMSPNTGEIVRKIVILTVKLELGRVVSSHSSTRVLSTENVQQKTMMVHLGVVHRWTEMVFM